MQYLKTYLNTINGRGKTGFADSIKKTAEEVGSRYIEKFSFLSHEVGLLFGNIQSGKTGQMFGIMCRAADLGFPVFLILTTDNVALQQQTLERAKSELDGFCVCGENDNGIFTENNLVKPAIVVLKKNARVLRLWTNILSSTGFIKGNPLFIIDDEGDAASLNTLINRGDQSSINRYLDVIKNEASSSLYLQVTGTPQALLLQTMISGWHPYFTYYFQPGETYLGGDFFFPATGKPKHISFLEETFMPVWDAVVRHLTVSAQILASGGKVSNCLFHPSIRVAAHKQCADDVAEALEWCRKHADREFTAEVKKHYNRISPEKSEKYPLEIILGKAKELLKPGTVKVLIMNGKNDIEITEYNVGCNFIIGGNTLGRGITFPSLHTIFYTRTSKKPQADTMWQHSRMFGYDRDPGMMMVYIDKRLYALFSDINSTNNSLIGQIEHGIENIKVYYPKELNPTRRNVIDNKKLNIIPGGKNYYPSDLDNDSIDNISKLLEKFSDKESYYQVSLHLIKEILSHIVPGPNFKLKAFQSVLSIILSENPVGQGILIVRRNRNVAQGTGALLSPNDWELGESFTDKPVLTMYQVTGTKGWKNKPLWVPNIKLPSGIVYYDIAEDGD